MNKINFIPADGQSHEIPVSAARFVLLQDGDCHWYLVPVDRMTEFQSWAELPSEDERAWETPEYAECVGGSPSLVTFADPSIG